MTTELESGTLALCRELVRIESPSGGEQDVAAAIERAVTAAKSPIEAEADAPSELADFQWSQDDLDSVLQAIRAFDEED